jgi:hypothetical protein
MMRRSANPGEDLILLKQKVRRLMEGEALTSTMNETKWRELCMAMGSRAHPPPFRLHDLFARPGYVSGWDREWYYHPFPYVSIEWLEIEPMAGEKLELEEILRAVGAPFEVHGNLLRVYGYRRGGTSGTSRSQGME